MAEATLVDGMGCKIVKSIVYAFKALNIERQEKRSESKTEFLGIMEAEWEE